MAPSSGIEAVAERSELIRRALRVARGLHQGAVRDVGDDVPFVAHPIAVAELVAERGMGAETVAAGLLHDTLEYTTLGLDELHKPFGMKVAMIVCSLSEDFEIYDYKERKQELRQRVAATGGEAQRVFAADKIANVIAVRQAYEVDGEEVDVGLPVMLDQQILIWEYDLEMLFDAEEGEPLFNRLADELVGLWRQRSAELASPPL